MPENPLGAVATSPVRRLVCVAPNASVDKITAVDALRPGEIHRPEVLSVVAGGKALNAARAAATLGLAVVAVPVLAGHAGAWIADALAADGIEARPVWVEGETRECLSVLDRATGRLTEFYEAGPPMGATAWAHVEAIIAAAVAEDPEGTIVLVSGSLPAGAPPDAHARAVRVVREAGGRAVIDVGGPALAGAVAEGPWLAKVNALDASPARRRGGGAGGRPCAAGCRRVDGVRLARRGRRCPRGRVGERLADRTAARVRCLPGGERGFADGRLRGRARRGPATPRGRASRSGRCRCQRPAPGPGSGGSR